MTYKKKAIVIAGSRGVGKAIAEGLKDLKYNLVITSSKSLDTSNINNVEDFIKKNKSTDILVLNTGGPPPKKLNEVTKSEWEKYFNQLFLSFVLMLKKIKVRKNGYVFLISSLYIKEPKDNMVISNSMRLAMSSILKTYGQENLKNNITTLNLALGPIYTDRFKELNKNKNRKQIDKSHPLGRIGNPMEISKIVKSIIKNEIKYLNSQTIVIDGGISKSLF